MKVFYIALAILSLVDSSLLFAMKPETKKAAIELYSFFKRKNFPSDIADAIVALTVEPEKLLMNPKISVSLLNHITYKDILSLHDHGESPLHLHIEKKNHQIVKLLLDLEDKRFFLRLGARQLAFRKDALTPFQLICVKDTPAMFGLLLNSSAFTQNISYLEMLEAVLGKNSEKILHTYGEKLKEKEEQKIIKWEFFINSATTKDAYKSIRWLYQKKVITHEHVTSVFIADDYDDVDKKMDLFFKAGIAIPQTALATALEKKDFRRIAWLATKLEREKESVEYGIEHYDLNEIPQKDLMPHDVARCGCSFKALQLLFNKKVVFDLNKKDSEGNTPLHYAAQRTKMKAREPFALWHDLRKTWFFWSKGGSLRIENNKKQTPLGIWARRLPEIGVYTSLFTGIGLASKWFFLGVSDWKIKS